MERAIENFRRQVEVWPRQSLTVEYSAFATLRLRVKRVGAIHGCKITGPRAPNNREVDHRL